MSNDFDPSIMEFPKLVVFDLDYTLWPYWVDTNVAPPFNKVGNKVLDTKGQIITFYPDVPLILKYLKQNNVMVAAASRTTEISGALLLIDLFNWNQYFDYKEIFPGQKTTHFANLKHITSLEYKDMVFYDDEERNIKDVSKLGVTCVPVNNGMNKTVLIEGLKKWESKN